MFRLVMPGVSNMKRWAVVAITLLWLGGGCAARDWWWNVFGNGYTEGGYTREDRRAHFDQQYDAWEAAQRNYDPTAER
jgi:hypothetical protein